MENADPDALVRECRVKGYRAAAMPLAVLGDAETVRSIAAAFSEAGIVLAEMGAWINPQHHDPTKRQENIDEIARVLALSDEVGAVCCTTVVGSYSEADDWLAHVGHHPKNFSQQAFDEVVAWVRTVLDDVHPTRTKLTLEICPWTLLDSVDMYLELIRAVDRPGLGVHLDPANLVICPRTFYDTTAMIDDCFDRLEPYIVSCHAKDVHWTLDARTVGIEEVVPGRGILDYTTMVRRAHSLSPDLSLIIEHIETEANFDEAASYIKRVCSEADVDV
jgi:sugar phosphate isomerase/epimerase